MSSEAKGDKLSAKPTILSLLALPHQRLTKRSPGSGATMLVASQLVLMSKALRSVRGGVQELL